MAERVDEAKLRERAVRAFGRRARSSGIRAVSMASLAQELGSSTKTLYRVFPSKERLVEEAVATWVDRLVHQLQERALPDDPLRALLHSSDVWEAEARRFAPPFWEELARDYPRAYAMVVDARRRYRAAVRERAQLFLRDDIPADLALELLDVLLRAVLDGDGAGSSREAFRRRMLLAVDLWAHGALKDAARSS